MERTTLARQLRNPGLIESVHVPFPTGGTEISVETDGDVEFLSRPGNTLWMGIFSSTDGGATWLFESSCVFVGDPAHEQQCWIKQPITRTEILKRHRAERTSSILIKAVCALVGGSANLGIDLTVK